jgi:hypothetical protein
VITRRTEERLELISAIVMVLCGLSGAGLLFAGAVGPGLALLIVAAAAGYMADLGRP